ncbi:MAG: hypothetical protein PHG48_07885, partial [Eubacteriales bacterium]|nr:hypothetical protein [Eubacteriales bacterium]
MPKSGKTLFEGWFYFMSGVGMLAAPFAGSAILSGMSSVAGLSGSPAGEAYRFLYLASFVMVTLLSGYNIYAMFRKKGVEKP